MTTVTERTRLLAEAASILRQSTFTKESSSKVESLLALADRYSDQTDLRKATMHARDIELGRAIETPEPTPADQEFRNYLLASELSEVRRLEKEQRAGLGVTTDSAGGWLTPATFAQQVSSAMAAFDPLFRPDVCQVFETTHGSPFVWPLVDDDTKFASIVPEGTTSNTSADVLFGGIPFDKVPTWRSGFVAVSWELISDSLFPIETVLANAFAKRLARGVGRFMVGILQATAPVGVTAAAPTTVTGDEVLNLMDALNADFQPNAAWLMAQGTLNALHRLKASTGGEYLFECEQSPDGQQLLAGRRVYASPSMDSLAAVGYPIGFGDFSYFLRRVAAGGFAIKAYPERNATEGKATFEGYLRTDAAILQTSTSSPIVLLQAQGGS